MSELRWILLGLGLLVIGGIYLLWGRDLGLRKPLRKKSFDFDFGERQEPQFADSDAVNPYDSRPDQSPDSVAEGGNSEVVRSMPGPAGRDNIEAKQKAATNEQASGPQKIIILHIAARGSQRFPGQDVVDALKSEGLEHGRFNIFHRLSQPTGESVFSAASMVEPGSFDLNNLEGVTTPGLSLFLVLPGPEDAAESFSDMLIAARSLAQKLGGDVLDEQGSSLSNQTAGHIREEITAFQLRLRALENMHA